MAIYFNDSTLAPTGAAPVAWWCMYHRPSLRAGSLSLMHEGSAACLWSCVHACIVMHLTCHTFWWPCPICDLSCFGHVSMVLYINILWYVRAPAPSMVPGPATWLLTSTTRRYINRVPCAPKSRILPARQRVAERPTYPRSEVRSPQVLGVSLGGFDPSQ